jgi:NADPH2:quinone reductase
MGIYHQRASLHSLTDRRKGMDLAIRVTHPGGAEQLEAAQCPPQSPGKGEIRLRHEAIGVNFLDIYHRKGLYPLPAPGIPGVEGVGRIEALGEGVEGLEPGQRVAYAGLAGGYATTRLLPAWRAIPLPERADGTVVAGSLLRGLTAHMLLTRSYPVGAGTTVLVHAAAGGWAPSSRAGPRILALA